MTIMDNVFLGNIPDNSFGLVNTVEMRERTKELLNKFSINLDPATPIKKLSFSEKQLVEIAKALSKNAKMIIMDEPNSALSPSETEFLFGIISKLKENGVTILFISHRLDEVYKIADRITVLRDGKLISTVNKDETTITEIVSMMVGRKLQQALYTTEKKIRSQLSNEEVLSVSGITQDKQFKNISFRFNAA